MENPLEMEVLIGTSPINSVFSIAMFDSRNVTKNRVSKLSKLINHWISMQASRHKCTLWRQRGDVDFLRFFTETRGHMEKGIKKEYGIL